MGIFIVLPYYIKWHYGQAMIDLVSIWENFMSFIYRFFSIKDLTRHLFSPWQRMQEGYAKGSSLEDIASAKFVNLMMRFVGFLVRILFIVLGLIFLILCLSLGIVVFFAWIFLPFITIYAFTYGIVLLI